MEVIYGVRTTNTGKTVTNNLTRPLKKREIEVNPKVNFLMSSSLTKDKTTTINGHKKPISVLRTKRKAEDAFECRQVKRTKLDHCEGILAMLMNHKWSVPFHGPVNPDTSGRVVKHHMDFGTIKRKLQQNKYTHLEEFAADVRLVFANAKLYYPSNNQTHISAMKLNRLFDILWMPVIGKGMSVKGKGIRKPIINQNLSSGNNSVEDTYNTKDKCPENLPEYSPSKALRVENLKARFADTILRAQTKINVASGNATDVVTSDQRQRDLEAARAALKKGNATDVVTSDQRQRDREAARAALKKVERSVDLEDNWRVMRDLEGLIRRPMMVVWGPWNRSKSGNNRSPLEKLGLYLKPEYRLDDDHDELFVHDMELEEGELVD